MMRIRPSDRMQEGRNVCQIKSSPADWQLPSWASRVAHQIRARGRASAAFFRKCSSGSCHRPSPASAQRTGRPYSWHDDVPVAILRCSEETFACKLNLPRHFSSSIAALAGTDGNAVGQFHLVLDIRKGTGAMVALSKLSEGSRKTSLDERRGRTESVHMRACRDIDSGRIWL